MLFYVLVFVPSLLGSGEGSFPPEDRQKGVRLATTSGWRFVDATSSRNVRDRPMARWEFRTHLNFDNKDGDDAGQISYPSILEKPSPLRLLPSMTHRLRSTGSNLEVTNGILRKEETRKPEKYCTIDVSPARSDAPMLEVTGERHRLRLASDMTPRIKRIVVRCPRRRIHNQMIQEPISVDEPGWILIDVTPDELRDDYDQEDPFYVARGKRPSPVDHRTKEDEETNLGMFLDEEVDGTSARKKRDALVESLRRYLLEGEQTSLVSSRSTEQDYEGEPVSRRNKHSDLFDILNEPFFISRGKKDSSGKTAFHPTNNGYSRARLNFQAARRVLDTLMPQGTKTNCDPKNAINHARFLETRTNAAVDQSFRDRPSIANLKSDLEFTKITDNH